MKNYKLVKIDLLYSFFDDLRNNVFLTEKMKTQIKNCDNNFLILVLSFLEINSLKNKDCFLEISFNIDVFLFFITKINDIILTDIDNMFQLSILNLISYIFNKINLIISKIYDSNKDKDNTDIYDNFINAINVVDIINNILNKNILSASDKDMEIILDISFNKFRKNLLIVFTKIIINNLE